MFFSTQNMFENQLKTGLHIYKLLDQFPILGFASNLYKKFDEMDRLTDATSIIVGNTSYRVAEK